MGPYLLARAERVTLSPSAEEPGHQHLPEPFPVAVVTDELLRLGDAFGRPAKRKVRGDPTLRGRESELLEPARLGVDETRYPGVRISTPPRQRLPRRASGALWPTVGRSLTPESHQTRDPFGVDVRRLPRQPVFRPSVNKRAGDPDPGGSSTSQPQHKRLHRLGRTGRQTVTANAVTPRRVIRLACTRQHAREGMRVMTKASAHVRHIAACSSCWLEMGSRLQALQNFRLLRLKLLIGQDPRVSQLRKVA